MIRREWASPMGRISDPTEYVEPLGKRRHGLGLQGLRAQARPPRRPQGPAPEFLHDPTFAERFLREAKAVAKPRAPEHRPHLRVRHREAACPGWRCASSPAARSRAWSSAGRLDPARAVRILKGTAEALTYAHGKGVVHRDVKPQNILLDENERVYLADFGIAKMLEGANKLTQTGMISGTPQYMAPEQATGTKVDERADIYALGIVAYELLTGHVPFAADTPVAVLMKHVQDPIPLPSPTEVKEPLMRALLKALAKKPEDRWPSAVAFVEALESALERRAHGDRLADAGADLQPGRALVGRAYAGRAGTPRARRRGLRYPRHPPPANGRTVDGRDRPRRGDVRPPPCLRGAIALGGVAGAGPRRGRVVLDDPSGRHRTRIGPCPRRRWMERPWPRNRVPRRRPRLPPRRHRPSRPRLLPSPSRPCPRR